MFTAVRSIFSSLTSDTAEEKDQYSEAVIEFTNKHSRDEGVKIAVSSENPTPTQEQDKNAKVSDVLNLKDTLVLAKEWSSHIYKKVIESSESTAHRLTETVKLSEVGVNVKNVIDKVPVLREFQQSQTEFACEQSAKSPLSTSNISPCPTILPWHPDSSGLTDPEVTAKLRSRILALSLQPNTFLLAPPKEAQIDETTINCSSPETVQLALALLREDPNLEAMRYKLVPSRISEDVFWRNYFYRVSVVRQSFQLSLMTGSADADDDPDFVCVEKAAAWNELSPPEKSTENKQAQATSTTPPRTKDGIKKSVKPPEVSNRKIKSKQEDRSSLNGSQTDQTKDLTVEQQLEAELAREVDEMVLVPSATTHIATDELERELELELLAELDRAKSK
ncbi:Synapse-associated protein [Paragonimus heterotremus]|uniref:Synapse-associated protein n=1 Tax=Paragonimus heterotremus TaxID=100268 RepID=A0A8J4T016_9TREM|nr:Synapse-associated protein [Paragonimus heterotremus]